MRTGWERTLLRWRKNSERTEDGRTGRENPVDVVLANDTVWKVTQDMIQLYRTHVKSFKIFKVFDVTRWWCGLIRMYSTVPKKKN